MTCCVQNAIHKELDEVFSIAHHAHELRHKRQLLLAGGRQRCKRVQQAGKRILEPLRRHMLWAACLGDR